jgi:two-component system, chemotaxis family, sensor kinase CheA
MSDSGKSNNELGGDLLSTALSLDEIAGMLVPLEDHDLDGLSALRDALISLPQELPTIVREKVNRMIAKLGIFLEDGGDGEQLLEALCELVESAILDMEDLALGGPVTPDKPAAGEDSATIAAVEEPVAPVADSTPEPTPEPIPEPTPEPVADPVAEATPDHFSLPEDSDEELLGDYITESRECIEDAEGALLELEEDPCDDEAVNRVFRAFHTIKGTSAFLGLDVIAELAHKAETILSRVRDGEIQFNQHYASLALRSVDMLKDLFDNLETGLGTGGDMAVPGPYGELLSVLKNPEGGTPADSAPAEATATEAAPPEAPTAEQPRPETEPVAEAAKPNPVPEKMESGSKPVAASTPAQAANPARQKKRVESTVRMRTDRLDRLIDMVGELVIAHTIVAQDDTVALADEHALQKKVAHTGKIVRELQDLSMSMRMVPLKGTFQKMARLVRDLGVKSGKEVRFIGEGDDTEIDRNMVDLINDPLVHMIRNAVDHGIEPAGDRAATGKPDVGEVVLKAFHAGGNVIVELRDDGRGLSREKLAAKAVDKGMIESDKGMSDQDVFNLIFEAGFSTAAQVTDISGRGVGMDVVRRNIEALRGRVDISSTFGRGSTFSIRLPLTMAITDGMLIRVGEERFIVPTLNIKMSLRPEASALSSVAQRGEMLMLMEELIPLYRLSDLFGISGSVQDPTDGLVIVMDDGDHRFAVLVDELLGKLQVVAKSLGEGVGKVPGVSGGAILGDGRVGLILDPQGLFDMLRQGGGLRPEALVAGRS